MSPRQLVVSATAFLLCSLAVHAAVIFPPLAVATTAQKLIPRRPLTTDYNGSHDSLDNNIFLPKRTIVLEYSYSTTTALVSFDASKTYPAVSVLTFDSLLTSIQCDTSGEIDAKMSMKFISEDAVIAASEAWDLYHGFHMVTSHPGCNLDDEMGAWRVYAFETNLMSHSIKLSVEGISLNQLGSYNIAILGHELSGAWNPQANEKALDRRMTFASSLNKDLSGTEVLSVDTSNLPADIGSKVTDSKLDIQCTECTFNFNFTVDVNMSIADLSITALSISTTVNSFDQSVLLGVSVGAGPVTLSHLRDLFNLPLTPLEIRDLFNLGPEVGVAAEIDLDISAAMQFSVGAKASIAPGTWATFDFLNLTESDKGWDSATIDSIPLKVQGGQLNATLTASISPFIGIGITPPLNSGEPFVEVRISQNAPSVVLASTLATAVNRNCEPIGTNDFESFATAYQITADMQFGTHIGLVGNVADLLPPWDTVFPHGDFQLLNHTGQDGNKTCFVVVDAGQSASTTKGAESALQTPAPTGTLLAAASAVPTFDVPKIVSYFSANGQLPTNVNYDQLSQATTVPDSIKSPVQKVVQNQTKSNGSSSMISSWVGCMLSCGMFVVAGTLLV